MCEGVKEDGAYSLRLWTPTSSDMLAEVKWKCRGGISWHWTVELIGLTSAGRVAARLKLVLLMLRTN